MEQDVAVPDSHRDLAVGATAVVMTTVNADGTPQSTAVWSMLADDGTIKVSFKTGHQKHRNLARHPFATFFFLDRGDDWRWLEVRCRVELEPDDDERTWTRRIVESFGVDPATFGATIQADRQIATCHPVRVVTLG